MEPGARLGRYTIQGLIGRGGMGTVYRDTDPSLGRDVALKVLPADVASDPGPWCRVLSGAQSKRSSARRPEKRRVQQGVHRAAPAPCARFDIRA